MSDRRSLLLGVVILVLCLAFVACTPTVAIQSTAPGPVAVGAVRDFVIVDGAGRPDARDAVTYELIRQARAGGWFTVQDRSDEGRRVRVAGRRVEVRPRLRLSPETAGLRLDVHEWQASRHSRTVETKHDDGEVSRETIVSRHGSVVLGVTLFDTSGEALVAEREYVGTFTGRVGRFSKDEVIERAASVALSRFLFEVTPRRVTHRVRLDDDDEGQEEILEIVRDGHTDLAERRLRAYADHHPGNPAAAYNLAVVLDARGHYAAALDWYDRALELAYKDYYAAARAACARRVADADALRSQPPAARAR